MLSAQLVVKLIPDTLSFIIDSETNDSLKLKDYLNYASKLKAKGDLNELYLVLKAGIEFSDSLKNKPGLAIYRGKLELSIAQFYFFKLNDITGALSASSEALFVADSIK